MKASTAALVRLLGLRFLLCQASGHSAEIGYAPATYCTSHYDQTSRRTAFADFSRPPSAVLVSGVCQGLGRPQTYSSACSVFPWLRKLVTSFHSRRSGWQVGRCWDSPNCCWGRLSAHLSQLFDHFVPVHHRVACSIYFLGRNQHLNQVS